MNPRELPNTPKFIISKVEFTDAGSSAWFYILKESAGGVELVLKVPRKFKFQTESEYSVKAQVEMLALKLLQNISVVEGEKVSVRTIKVIGIVTFDPTLKDKATFIPDVRAETGTDIPEEIGIALEYLKEYTALDRFQFNSKEEKNLVLMAIEKYVLEMIKKGVATRDLKGSNFQIKRSGSQFEVVFIDPGLCQIKFKNKAGQEESVGTSTDRDVGSYITAFPPNFEGKKLTDPFKQESISMRWCLALLKFWIYFGFYPFCLNSKNKALNLEGFTDLGYSLPGFIESISAKYHTFVRLEDMLQNYDNEDKAVYDSLLGELENLLRSA